MRLKISVFLCVLVSCFLTSCKNDASAGLKEYDLIQYGMPVKIKAPEGAEFEESDLLVMKDVSVKKGSDFFVQIFSSETSSSDAAAALASIKDEVKADQYFQEMVQEDKDGFIFKKQIDDLVKYDFRHVKVKGDTEYVFQTGLLGKFTLEDVKKMYAAVK